MKYKFLVFMLAMISFQAANAQIRWNTESLEVKFIIKNAGFNVDGEFEKAEVISLLFDPERPSLSSIEARVDVQSINTGISARDKHLRNEDYFNVEEYPYIRMKSIKVKAFTDGTFAADFELTIKDVTKTIEVPFEFKQEGDKAVFTGSFEINRIDYHVGEGSISLSDKVKIFLTLNAQK